MRVRATVMSGIGPLAVAALIGCSSSPPGRGDRAPGDGGSQVVESCGLELTFESAPERTVTLSQAATEVMLELGLEDRMVGTANLYGAIPDHLLSSYGEVPVLAAEIPPLEEILDTEPDFIYGTIGSIFTPAEAGDRAEMRDLGINVFLSNMNCENSPVDPVPATYDAVFEEIRTIGSIFGVEDRAEKFVAGLQKLGY